MDLAWTNPSSYSWAAYILTDYYISNDVNIRTLEDSYSLWMILGIHFYQHSPLKLSPPAQYHEMGTLTLFNTFPTQFWYHAWFMTAIIFFNYIESFKKSSGALSSTSAFRQMRCGLVWHTWPGSQHFHQFGCKISLHAEIASNSFPTMLKLSIFA